MSRIYVAVVVVVVVTAFFYLCMSNILIVQVSCDINKIAFDLTYAYDERQMIDTIRCLFLYIFSINFVFCLSHRLRGK